MTTVVGHTEGSYEVHDVQLGKVYKWCPEKVEVRCECGERTTLIGLKTTCGWCVADHAVPVQKELDTWQPEDEDVHPWRYSGDREDVGIPY